MKKRGWRIDEASVNNLREGSTFTWFKNTIMVFRKDINTNKRKYSVRVIKNLFK
jgi:hypothetical protein